MGSQQQQQLSRVADVNGARIELQANHRKSSMPSRQMTPPVSFYNLQNLPFRYVPGTRMINIPPPQNYPTVDGIARPPSPYVNRHASMPIPPLTGFGPPFGKPVIGRKSLQSKLVERAATSPGHRRNKTTISSFPDFASSNTTRSRAETNEGVNKQISVNTLLPRVTEKMQDHEKPTLPKFNSDPFKSINSSDNCGALTSSIGEFQALHHSNDPFGSPSTRYQGLDHESSTYSKEEFASIVPYRTHGRNLSSNSSSTVASDSWNFMDSTLNIESVAEYAQKIPKQKTYCLDEYVQGSPEHEVKVYDFAPVSGPLKNHRSASGSSASSSRILIDLDEHKERQNQGNEAQSTDGAVTCKRNDAFQLPATPYRPLTANNNEPIDAICDEDPLISTSRERLITSNNLGQAHQKLKKCNPSSTLELLSRASDSISNVAAAHAGMTPPKVHKTGTIDRDFQFPACSTEQRFSSASNLCSRATKAHSRSISRFLEGFGSKNKGNKKLGNAKKGSKVADQHKSRDSLARRISTRLSDFIVRTGL